MAKDARKGRKDADLIQGLAAPLAMRMEKGELGIGGTVQPVAFAADVDTGLIGMDQAL